MKKFIIFLVLAGVLGVAVFTFRSQPKLEREAPSMNISGTSIKLLIADTAESRELGLGGREDLADDEAMLFVFETADQYEFWMKDMLFALDIVWLDSDFRIIDFVENVAPETFPDETFMPSSDALYTLEVKAGFVTKHHLKKGDVVEINLSN